MHPWIERCCCRAFSQLPPASKREAYFSTSSKKHRYWREREAWEQSLPGAAIPHELDFTLLAKTIISFWSTKNYKESINSSQDKTSTPLRELHDGNIICKLSLHTYEKPEAMIILQPKQVKSMMLLIERMRKINRSLHSTSLQELMKHPGYWDPPTSLRWGVCGWGMWMQMQSPPWASRYLVTSPESFFLFYVLPILFCGSDWILPGGMIFIMGSRKCTLYSQVTKITTLIQKAQFPHRWKSSKGHTLRKPRETSVSWTWPSLPSPTCLPVLLNSCIKFINWAAGRK